MQIPEWPRVLPYAVLATTFCSSLLLAVEQVSCPFSFLSLPIREMCPLEWQDYNTAFFHLHRKVLPKSEKKKFSKKKVSISYSDREPDFFPSPLSLEILRPNDSDATSDMLVILK